MTEHAAYAAMWNRIITLTQSANVCEAAMGKQTTTFDSQPVSMTSASSIAYSTEAKTSVIVKCALLFFISLIGFIGNGTAVVTMRNTPKLCTKTYALLASLTVSDLLVGFTSYWLIAYLTLVHILNENPCSYITVVAAFACPQRIPSAVTMMHVCLVSVERYIAIVHPLHYESWITDSTIKAMIAFGWIVPIIPCSFYFSQINRINWSTCTIVASVLQTATTDICYILFITSVILILNTSILLSALRQRAKISAQLSEGQVATGQQVPASHSTGKKLQRELKAVRLTASIVGCFIVLWTPYMIGRLIQASGVNPVLGQYISDIGMALGNVNSCVNWVIYGLVSREFRRAVYNLVIPQVQRCLS